uniref:INO80 complex subunit C n=1 Tax=Epinephelus lanceolatus TaxID=310571 RepID=UPI00144586BD|nr:INO80 complex subunit C [Epinephelus lanceolatus]
MAAQIPTTVRAPPAAATSAALRGKKRPASPAVSAAQQVTGTGSCSIKKKKGLLTVTPATQITAVESVAEVKPVGTADCCPATIAEPPAKPPPFKDPTFMHSGIGGAAAGKKNRTWKNLKQILALERTLSWKLNDPSSTMKSKLVDRSGRPAPEGCPVELPSLSKLVMRSKSGGLADFLEDEILYLSGTSLAK